ncbi:MAG: starch synthase [Candidatus Yanofskybacteria bacterium CG10_big_fil_rev_8_21_14_0_10_37_15]|uniref:Glycogen synthase n=1 Tax=Candidatus Yanofskybacteria bacterium CG10_big_fil_rev_8_21_14_0_10_37_15 TaxID=1975097 RepID=A0A2H0R574_9BACT|nr:MAG: starch synthase [Candidatus Yanofskybacteria bacterium CG10_big_fil_rev_8_21_14_0_10_37_15]
MGKQLKFKILFVASEAAPFVKVGGLGEVMYSLPKALRDLGHDARVMIPKYATIDTKKHKMTLEAEGLRLGTSETDPQGILISNVLKNEIDGNISYFLENMEYYEKRANVYGYGDDTIRWALLSKGVLEFLKISNWKPDIIVACDWQAGFIPNYLHIEYENDPVLKNITTLFSIHNLKYQGMFDTNFVNEMDYDAGQQPIPVLPNERILKLNGMKRGIFYADVINTVSPTYSKEILSKESGENLDKLLNERKGRLFGILNGIDTDSFNPETDPDLDINYNHKTTDKRKQNKLALQKQFGIEINENKFVAGIVSRMDEQKGFDILIQMIDKFMQNLDSQLVIVGEGDSKYRLFFEDLKKKYPDKVGIHFSFDFRLPRLIFAGADVVLLPSKFEPCGLVQMEAMRYGAVPIVRKVGGLADSVQDFNPETGKGTGFVFEKFDPFSLTIAMVRAYQIYHQKNLWKKIIKNAINQDFSWKRSAFEYVKLFEMAIRLHKEKIK